MKNFCMIGNLTEAPIAAESSRRWGTVATNVEMDGDYSEEFIDLQSATFHSLRGFEVTVK